MNTATQPIVRPTVSSETSISLNSFEASAEPKISTISAGTKPA